jgi:hypothetical protein
MSSTLASGCALNTSVAACRIAAMLCLASERCRLRLTRGPADPVMTKLLSLDKLVRNNLALTIV